VAGCEDCPPIGDKWLYLRILPHVLSFSRRMTTRPFGFGVELEQGIGQVAKQGGPTCRDPQCTTAVTPSFQSCGAW
jgi:hypothetical protein